MGQRVSREDFEHSYTDQIHATRRLQILKKHPEIKTLFGPDPMLAFWVCLLVTIQYATLPLVYRLTWGQTFVAAYCFGGTLSHSLFLAMHELSHNLAFGHKHIWANRMIGFISNLASGIPAFTNFRYYHHKHHKYLAVTGQDPDLPTKWEGYLFCTTLGKCVWLFFVPLFYTLRPMIVDPKPIMRIDVANLLFVMASNFTIWYLFDARTMLYLIIGSFLSMGLHPMSAHFIAEHYMFFKGKETSSYYGPFNYISFNVGYHNEHHDFPYVPFSRLPMITKMAPEFYANLPQHESWLRVIYQFLTDPEMGTFARIVRETKFSNPLLNETNDGVAVECNLSLVSPGKLENKTTANIRLRNGIGNGHDKKGNLNDINGNISNR